MVVKVEGVMTVQQLIEKLVHLPPGMVLGLFPQNGGSVFMGVTDADGNLDEVLWQDPYFKDEGEDMTESTKQQNGVIEQANSQEKDVLRVAYQFHASGQRKGQALMNALSMRAPELYHTLTASPNDPFHDDSRLQPALDELGFKIRRFW